MQFDQHRIVIRERTYLEVLDLALALVRDRGWPLQLAIAVGAIPFALLNYWLLGEAAAIDLADQRTPGGYVYWLLLLTAIEIPLATAPATIYLGMSMFTDHPRARNVARDFFRSFGQLFWYQGVLRAPLIISHLLIFLPFSNWPYLTEVIVLERNPYSASNAKVMTTRKRSRNLHKDNMGDQFSQWIGSLGFGAVLLIAIWLALWVLTSQLAGKWVSDRTVFLVLLPLALWVVVGFFAVVRYLLYLDLRIRHEGWEVELALRAEANKLVRQPA
jgi:hypothetical protein